MIWNGDRRLAELDCPAATATNTDAFIFRAHQLICEMEGAMLHQAGKLRRDS
jgi:hypothetical protein